MNEILKRVGPVVKKTFWNLVQIVGLYLDDLLLVAGGICVICGVHELAGRPWALLTAGAWLTAYAVVVARSRRGGGG